jgi:hypothetical protein
MHISHSSADLTLPCYAGSPLSNLLVKATGPVIDFQPCNLVSIRLDEGVHRGIYM